MLVCVCVCLYTGSDDPLDADPGWVDLFGELVDGLRGVLICIRVHVGLYPRERDCGDREKHSETMSWRVLLNRPILIRLEGIISLKTYIQIKR